MNGGMMSGRLRKYLPDDWDILLVILVSALALRIYFALMPGVRVAATYGTDYVQGAAGPFPASNAAPLYPIFLKAILSVSSDALAPVYIMQAVLLSASVILLWYAGTRIGSRATGLTAAVLAALYPGTILYSVSPTPAAALFFLSSVLIAAGAAAGSGEIGETAAAAISAAAAAVGILTDQSFIFIVPNRRHRNINPSTRGVSPSKYNGINTRC